LLRTFLYHAAFDHYQTRNAQTQPHHATAGESQMAALKHGQSRVRAAYPDSEVEFDLPANATLEQLAATLAALGAGHGLPLRVELGVHPDVLHAGVSYGSSSNVPAWSKIF
jgi:hypothetical protein